METSLAHSEDIIRSNIIAFFFPSKKDKRLITEYILLVKCLEYTPNPRPKVLISVLSINPSFYNNQMAYSSRIFTEDL